MTEDELKAIESTGEWMHDQPPDAHDGRCFHHRVAALVAEVRRLKALVAQAAGRGIPMDSETRNCPWCGYAQGPWKRLHSPECPAFTETGAVR